MPSRVIREAILDSERYWSVPMEARELYRHLQLLADDLGCVSLAYTFVRRRAFDCNPSQERVNVLLSLLQDADLVRIYTHDGARYGFIPRFRQRLQIVNLRNPQPPSSLLVGDDDAIEKFNKINNKLRNTTVGQQQTTAIHQQSTAMHPPEVEVEVEVEEEQF